MPNPDASNTPLPPPNQFVEILTSVWGVLGILAATLSIGFSAGVYWDQWTESNPLKEQVTSLQKELASANEVLNGPALTAYNEVKTLRPQLALIQKENIELQAKNAQSLQWNIEWKNAYETLAKEHGFCKQQIDLNKGIYLLSKQRDEATVEIDRYLSGNCGANTPSCDLMPLAQRRLQALKENRDQLHARLLDLQSRLRCTTN